MHPTIISSETPIKKEIIINLFHAVDSSDWDLLVKCFDKNIIYERPGYQALVGLDELLNFYQHERVILSGEHYLEHIVIEGNYGACWGKFIGIHKNGSHINERFADVYSFKNGKFKSRRSHFFRAAV